ncbi:MAG: diacylglycerol kinase family protein [Candidatus Gastranaerophilaceae bacterium]|jgi:diacylglycerol kinase
MSKYKASGLAESIKFAIRGLFLTFKSQKNFRIECFIAFAVAIAAYILHLTCIEISILVFAVALILFAELTNTVVEFIVDAYFGNKYSILAKMAKDTSAGAVFMISLFSVLIGTLLFLPKIIVLLKTLVVLNH